MDLIYYWSECKDVAQWSVSRLPYYNYTYITTEIDFLMDMKADSFVKAMWYILIGFWLMMPDFTLLDLFCFSSHPRQQDWAAVIWLQLITGETKTVFPRTDASKTHLEVWWKSKKCLDQTRHPDWAVLLGDIYWLFLIPFHHAHLYHISVVPKL